MRRLYSIHTNLKTTSKIQDQSKNVNSPPPHYRFYPGVIIGLRKCAFEMSTEQAKPSVQTFGRKVSKIWRVFLFS